MANAFKNKAKTLNNDTLSTVFTAHTSGAAETVIHLSPRQKIPSNRIQSRQGPAVP